MKHLLSICSLFIGSLCNGQTVAITNTLANDAKLSVQITGTWSKDTFNVKTFTWTDPIMYTRTYSSNGNYSFIWGHKSALVTFQGSWRVKDAELIETETNAYGTGKHRAESMGGVTSLKIIHVDDHQLIYEAGGQTNILSR